MLCLVIQVIPLRLEQIVVQGDSIDSLLIKALKSNSEQLVNGDVVVVAQKIISKAEGQIVSLAKVPISAKARLLAKKHGKPAPLMELILRESKEVVVARGGIIITQTTHGFVCANSGVDQSNVDNYHAVLLPKDPDASSSALREQLKNRVGVDVAVIITDTFGRAFRKGQTNVAIGVSGIAPIKSYIGAQDMYGRRLRVTEIAIADEIASASELVMGKSDRVPFAIVRGYSYKRSKKTSARTLVRDKKEDLFREY